MRRLESCRDDFVAVGLGLAVVKSSNLDWLVNLLSILTIESHRVQLLV